MVELGTGAINKGPQILVNSFSYPTTLDWRLHAALQIVANCTTEYEDRIHSDSTFESLLFMVCVVFEI